MAASRRLDRNGKPKRSIFVRILRTIAIAILVAFSVGFLIGTMLRGEVDKPVRYMGFEPAHDARSTPA